MNEQIKENFFFQNLKKKNKVSNEMGRKEGKATYPKYKKKTEASNEM